MEDIVSFNTGIPGDIDDEETIPRTIVHIRMQKRSARKFLTLIEGMPKDIDLKKVLKYFKKAYSCSGTIVNNEETEEKVIQLTGDNRREVAKFLKEEYIVPEDCIRVHGH